MTENKELMRQAREALKDKWNVAILTSLIYLLITSTAPAFSSVKPFSPVIGLILGGPMALGLAIFSLAIARSKEVKMPMLFEGFNDFSRALVAYLLQFVFVLLWSLLLVVPGIIAAISYSQAYFILADDPSITAMDAIDKSKKMMYGYKWKFFCLCLRFTGWFLLCLLTLGIGFLWLIPYVHVSFAKFYEALKRETQSS